MAKGRVSKIQKELKQTTKKIKSKSPQLIDHLVDLPLLLQEGVDILKDDKEKEVYFVGLLGVVSGLLPNVSSSYNGSLTYPNLYVYILADYGSGKGILKYARAIGVDIHNSKKEEYEETKRNQPTISQFQELLFIPANTSKTGLTYLLAQNNESGIVFETESDTLANALNGSEHGKFSDILRKAFQHEGCSFFRSTSREHIELKSPRLSVVLSSTFDQLYTLIPTYENGLFSRFLFYTFQSDNKFAKVFDKKKSNYHLEFQKLSAKFKNAYDRLNLSSGVHFMFTKKQEKVFQSYFEETYEELTKYISKDLSGTVFRLGLICFRLCMIFSTLRIFESNETKLPKTIKCTDSDLEKVIQLVDIFKQNSQEIFFKLTPDRKESKKGVPTKQRDIDKVMSLHNSGKSYQEIANEMRISSKGVVYHMIQKELKRLNG